MGVGVGFRVAEPTIAPTGQATEVTRSLVVRALQTASFQVQDPLAGYRPGESPDLVDVPRKLVQVVMPEDPGAGYVVIYELPTADEADRVGGEFLRYLGWRHRRRPVPQGHPVRPAARGPDAGVLLVVRRGVPRRACRRAGRGTGDGRHLGEAVAVTQSFRATIIQTGKTACGIEVPEAVVAALGGSKRPAVVVTLDGYTYRNTVAPMGGGWWLGVSSEHREASGLKAGDEVTVTLALDTAPRELAIHPSWQPRSTPPLTRRRSSTASRTATSGCSRCPSREPATPRPRPGAW